MGNSPAQRSYHTAKAEGREAGEAHLRKHQLTAAHRELLVSCWPPHGLPKDSGGIQRAPYGSPSQTQGRLSQRALLESHHMGAGRLQGVELELP